MVAWVLLISVLMQFLSAFIALRLTRVTGWRSAWVLVFCALFFMGVRRAITLWGVLAGTAPRPLQFPEETVALAISALMLAGVWRIGPIFRSIVRSREELHVRKERLRILFDDSPVALLAMDLSGVKQALDDLRRGGVTDLEAFFREKPAELAACYARMKTTAANKAALALFGASSVEDLRRRFPELPLSQNDPARKGLALHKVFSGQTSFSHEVRIRALDGRPLDLILSFRVEPGNEDVLSRCLMSFSDLTALRQVERDAAEQRQALLHQRTESLAATGRLAAGVAHEINNPLQGIIAQLRLLTDEVPPEVARGRRMTLIEQSIERIRDIVQRLLALNRRPTGGASSCRMSEVVDQVLSLTSSQLTTQGVYVESAVNPPDLEVPMSAGSLSQVMLNLVLNAGDAMPGGGTVRVEAEKVGESVRVSVMDSGTGLSPEAHIKLFSPFFTTKGPQGTGLGLSVCHSLVTEAGGRIEALDRPEGGAVFRILFEPRAHAPA